MTSKKKLKDRNISINSCHDNIKKGYNNNGSAEGHGALAMQGLQ